MSVFDLLRSPSHYPNTDYITLEQLGIHVHANSYTRPSDMDSSSNPCMTEFAEGERNRRKLSSLTVGCSLTELKSPTGSTFSLTMDMIRTKFDLRGIFYNTHVASNGSEEICSHDSIEPLDFVEEGLRIDIGGISDEDDRSYFVTRGCSECSENAPSVSFDIVSSEEYFNVQDGMEDVTNVSYPSNKNIEHCQRTSQITAHASLPSLVPISEPSLLSPLSTSVPSLCA